MYIRKPEWSKKKSIYFAWPCSKELWQEDLVKAQEEFLSLLNVLSPIHRTILVKDTHDKDIVKNLTIKGKYTIKIMPYGDIWCRDTLPIMVSDKNNEDALLLPKFNGWGNKYLFDDDKDLSQRVAVTLPFKKYISNLCFEGGAIEVNGEGILLTTTDCLLNENRNKHLSKHEIEKELEFCFFAKNIVWLNGCLINDHTDGHIDTLARFISPKQIVIMKPCNNQDPNFKTLVNIKAQLKNALHKVGDDFEIIEIASPGAIVDKDNTLLPASYLNFIIADDKIIVPTYNSKYDSFALEELQKHTDLKVIGKSAKAILSGGGAFHCISQEIF